MRLATHLENRHTTAYASPGALSILPTAAAFVPNRSNSYVAFSNRVPTASVADLLASSFVAKVVKPLLKLSHSIVKRLRWLVMRSEPLRKWYRPLRRRSQVDVMLSNAIVMLSQTVAKEVQAITKAITGRCDVATTLENEARAIAKMPKPPTSAKAARSNAFGKRGKSDNHKAGYRCGVWVVKITCCICIQ